MKFIRAHMFLTVVLVFVLIDAHVYAEDETGVNNCKLAKCAMEKIAACVSVWDITNSKYKDGTEPLAKTACDTAKDTCEKKCDAEEKDRLIREEKAEQRADKNKLDCKEKKESLEVIFKALDEECGKLSSKTCAEEAIKCAEMAGEADEEDGLIDSVGAGIASTFGSDPISSMKSGNALLSSRCKELGTEANKDRLKEAQQDLLDFKTSLNDERKEFLNSQTEYNKQKTEKLKEMNDAGKAFQLRVLDLKARLSKQQQNLVQQQFQAQQFIRELEMNKIKLRGQMAEVSAKLAADLLKSTDNLECQFEIIELRKKLTSKKNGAVSGLITSSSKNNDVYLSRYKNCLQKLKQDKNLAQSRHDNLMEALKTEMINTDEKIKEQKQFMDSKAREMANIQNEAVQQQAIDGKNLMQNILLTNQAIEKDDLQMKMKEFNHQFRFFDLQKNLNKMNNGLNNKAKSAVDTGYSIIDTNAMQIFDSFENECSANNCSYLCVKEFKNNTDECTAICPKTTIAQPKSPPANAKPSKIDCSGELVNECNKIQRFLMKNREQLDSYRNENTQ